MAARGRGALLRDRKGGSRSCATAREGRNLLRPHRQGHASRVTARWGEPIHAEMIAEWESLKQPPHLCPSPASPRHDEQFLPRSVIAQTFQELGIPHLLLSPMSQFLHSHRTKDRPPYYHTCLLPYSYKLRPTHHIKIATSTIHEKKIGAVFLLQWKIKSA